MKEKILQIQISPGKVKKHVLFELQMFGCLTLHLNGRKAHITVEPGIFGQQHPTCNIGWVERLWQGEKYSIATLLSPPHEQMSAFFFVPMKSVLRTKWIHRSQRGLDVTNNVLLNYTSHRRGNECIQKQISDFKNAQDLN